MSDLLARIENLSPARRKLLERMSATKQQQRRTYPLSYAQRGMWFIEQLEPNSALYNMPFPIRFEGRLNEEVMWKSVREIIRRHESLSTIFSERNGVAVQEVVPDMRHPMETVDLRHLSEIHREGEIRKLLREETLKPFNVTQGPLYRITFYKLTDLDQIIFFNMHHITSDGWSAGVMEHEFGELYRAFLAGEPSPLAPLELQYGDFALWQRGWLQSGAMQQQLDYWKNQLAEVAEVVLPTDYPRPSILSHQSKFIDFPIPSQFSIELREFCRQEGVTLFMALLAGLQVAMSRYMGVKDFAIGTPIANRNRLETEKLIGCFINTLVLRADLKGQLTFRQFLARIRETTLGAYDHQDMPFEKLVEELVPVQSLRWTPLFQVLFVLENFPSSPSELPGLTRSHVDSGLNLAKLEMALTVVERDGTLFGSFQYDAELFDRTKMQRLMEHFYLVLENMVFHQDRSIWEAPLPKSERDQVLEDWNRTETEYPQHKSVHVLFEEQASRTPDAVAFVQEDQQLSYDELNRRANQLARHLEKLGIQPETTVGVCMERCPELMVAFLGIVKAGGAYVPLDPAYPPDRLKFIAEDAGVKVMLAHDPTMGVVPQTAALVVNVSSDWALIRQHHDRDLPLKSLPENLAYIIYTSGSTGRPKGVAVSHRAVCNQLCWAAQAFQISAADRFLQKASVSFDSSVEEIFVPLVTGARIVAAKPRGEHDIEYLAELVATRGVTCIDLPPSLLQAFVDYPHPEVWNSVRLVISGGEALKPELVKAFPSKFSGTLLNTYGPTEATVQSAWADGLQQMESVPIGKPVANTQLYVLDETMEPVPVGVGGELYIGGVGLARGYVNRPELTAEKFVPSAFSASGGERLYRTGDLVKWSIDGQLEFLGRVDHQVKLRGYRIELGEIENALENHTQIKQAVVMVQEEQPGVNRLVAYVVKSSDGPELITTALREFLRESLPEYMLPAVWVELKELPLGPNGKIDRKALPRDAGQPISEKLVLPRNMTEEILAGLWEAVLKQDHVSVEANFFDLGGHSLLAMQLISRIRKAFSVETPLRTLFEAPTVASMAAYVSRQLQKEPAAEIPAIVPVARTGSLPLSFAQQRLWFLAQLVPFSAAYNIPLASRFTGHLDHDAFVRAWQQIVRRHEALRTYFPQKNGMPVQEIGNADEWQIEVVDLRLGSSESGIAEAEIWKLAGTEAEKPFDLATGPLFRVKLVQLVEQDHIAFVTMHHIVSDGWSIGLMLREFSQIYEAFVAGEHSPLQEMELQYADFAVWQREWLQGEILEKQVGYWKKQLANILPLELPTRPVRPELKSSAAAGVGWALSPELSADLKTLNRAHGATLFMTLLAAFQVLLSRYSGQKDVAIGTPIAGRQREETHNLIGFFINTLVLRTDLSGDPSFAELLKRVRETTLEAFAHQDVPFEKLVEELQPERDLTRQPFFQVMFVLQQIEKDEVRLPGLQVSGLDLDEGTHPAKFDLMLEVEDTKGRIQGSFVYNLDLFEPSMMEIMVRHWHLMLEQLVKEPGRPLSHISLVTADEQRMLAAGWRGSGTQEPVGQTVSALVARHAQRNPKALAIISQNDEFSYAALDQLANQWANYLISREIRPGTPVSVCLDQAVDCIVISLAVFKCGGVLVGLEPGEPAVRTAMMLEMSGAHFVITAKRLAERFAHTATQLIFTDEQSVEVAEESHHQPEIVMSAEDPACLLFRSSASGRSRVVHIPHRVLCGPPVSNETKESDRVALACSFSHELAAIEMFRILARGACVVDVPTNAPLAPRKVAALLRDQKVTVLWMTATALESLAREFPWSLKTVRQVLCTDPVRPLMKLREKLAVNLVQLVYGVHACTEAGGGIVSYPITSASETFMDVEHLTPGTRMYLLDSGMQPAAAGVSGEIYIGGHCVALGYGQDDQSSSAFKPDLFSTQAVARMYRTGDWARRHPDGTLEYRGRRDRQIIADGLRIVPEEIEEVLLRYEGVAQAAVVMREASAETKGGLMCLVVPAEGQVVAEEDLINFLLQQLPKAMVPKIITQVEKITRTAQGQIKLDTNIYVAPRTALEEEVAQIWNELLHLEQISIYDDFFRLGGHSLLAVRLKTLMYDRLHWELPLVELFRTPTIAGLAGLISQAQNEGVVAEASSPILVEIQPGDARTPLFFVHPVGGSVLCYVDLARELGAEQPFYALQSPGAGWPSEEVATVEQMAHLYIKMMRRARPSGPYFLGGWSMGGLLAWEIARQLTWEGETIGLLALVDTYPSDGVTKNEDRSESAMLSSFAQDIARTVGEDPVALDNAFQRFGPEDRRTATKELLLRHGLVPNDRAEEETARFLKVFTRNVNAMESYAMTKLDQSVTFFAAVDSGEPEQLAAEWKRWAAGGVDMHLVPGDHYMMMQRPAVTAIARALGRALAQHQEQTVSFVAAGASK